MRLSFGDGALEKKSKLVRWLIVCIDETDVIGMWCGWEEGGVGH